MRKFDLSWRSSRSSYFATFRQQLTILSKTDAVDEEKWLNMLGTFVKDWFRYESYFVHGRDSLVDILKERGLLSESDAVQTIICKKSRVKLLNNPYVSRPLWPLLSSFRLLPFWIYLKMISIFLRVTKFGLLLTALVLVAALRLAFMVRWTLYDTLAFLLLLSLLLPPLLIMFIPSTFKRPVSSWKALNLRKTLLMASSVRLKPLNCSRLPCVYAQETLTFLLTQKKTCVKNYVQKE